MFTETKNALSEMAIKKVSFFEKSISKYILASMLAGAYVGFGIFLIMTIGGIGEANSFPFTKVLMGVSFGIALSLVIMSGSELFTGNNLILTVGALDKKITWKQTLNLWFFSFLGNLIGSVIIGYLFVRTNLAGSDTGNFVLSLASKKMTADIDVLFVKGILCNILVCLAVLCSVKLKSESAKLIMIFWCLFAFITSGFEHSIANMSIFAMALFIPHSDMVSLYGMIYNLVPVTLGNIIGGSVFLGFSYYYLGKEA